MKGFLEPEHIHMYKMVGYQLDDDSKSLHVGIGWKITKPSNFETG